MKQEVTSVKTALRDTGSSLLYTCHSFSLMSISWKHNVQVPCDATCDLQNAAHKAGWISFRLYLVFHGEEASSADSFQRECLNERPLLHHEHVKPLHVSWNGQKLSDYPNHNRSLHDAMQCYSVSKQPGTWNLRVKHDDIYPASCKGRRYGSSPAPWWQNWRFWIPPLPPRLHTGSTRGKITGIS